MFLLKRFSATGAVEQRRGTHLERKKIVGRGDLQKERITETWVRRKLGPYQQRRRESDTYSPAGRGHTRLLKP